MNEPIILDPCCGSRMMWFDPPHLVRPLFGNTSGRKAGTHWMVFMKIYNEAAHE